MIETNYFTPLREMLYEQYNLSPFSVPVQVTGKLEGEKLLDLNRKGSISAYLIAAISRTLQNHPQLNSGFVRKRFRPRGFRTSIQRFEEISASVSVDKTFDNDRYPFTYVFRNSDQMSIKDIHEKLQHLISAKVSDVPEWSSYLKFMKLPKTARMIILKEMTKNKKSMFDKIGSFNFTNIGKWRGLEYAYANSPRLVIAIGRADENKKIPISYSFNHVICDGAQIGEFHQDLHTMIEKLNFDDIY